MGNKLSAVHGVKSENYFNPGNAINEIWFGDVEILSRMPFGDSDLAQAEWLPGQWPKIPWHNFIIPWKRSIVIENKNDNDAGMEMGIGMRGDGLALAARHGGGRGSGGDGDGVLASWVAASVLSLVVLAAWYLPIWLRKVSPSSRDVGLDEKSSVVRRGYAMRVYLAVTALVLGIAVGVLDFHAVHRMSGFGDGGVLVLLEALWAAGASYAFFCSVRAVAALWRDWRAVSRRCVHGDDGWNPLLDVASYLDRQCRP